MDPGELIERFSFFDDWEERYAYLIDLGRALPAIAESERTEEHRVQGCMSRVWLVQRPAADGTLRFDADSDSVLVKGLVAVLLLLVNGRGSDEVRGLDIAAIFAQLGLDQHLTPNRRNGFFAMVERVRRAAEAA